MFNAVGLIQPRRPGCGHGEARLVALPQQAVQVEIALHLCAAEIGDALVADRQAHLHTVWPKGDLHPHSAVGVAGLQAHLRLQARDIAGRRDVALQGRLVKRSLRDNLVDIALHEGAVAGAGRCCDLSPFDGTFQRPDPNDAVRHVLGFGGDRIHGDIVARVDRPERVGEPREIPGVQPATHEGPPGRLKLAGWKAGALDHHRPQRERLYRNGARKGCRGERSGPLDISARAWILVGEGLRRDPRNAGAGAHRHGAQADHQRGEKPGFRTHQRPSGDGWNRELTDGREGRRSPA